MNTAVTEHSKHFPSVELELHDIYSTRQNHALRERIIDVGFMRPPVDTGLMSESIVKEHFEAVICRKHRLAARKSVTLAELAGDSLLIHDRSWSSSLYDKILDLYRRAGVSPKVTQTSSFPYEEAGAMMIASGKDIYLGVSSSPGTGTTVCHPLFVDWLSVVPLNEPGAELDVHVAWRAREKLCGHSGIPEDGALRISNRACQWSSGQEFACSEGVMLISRRVKNGQIAPTGCAPQGHSQTQEGIECPLRYSAFLEVRF